MSSSSIAFLKALSKSYVIFPFCALLNSGLFIETMAIESFFLYVIVDLLLGIFILQKLNCEYLEDQEPLLLK